MTPPPQPLLRPPNHLLSKRTARPRTRPKLSARQIFAHKYERRNGRWSASVLLDKITYFAIVAADVDVDVADAPAAEAGRVFVTVVFITRIRCYNWPAFVRKSTPGECLQVQHTPSCPACRCTLNLEQCLPTAERMLVSKQEARYNAVFGSHVENRLITRPHYNHTVFYG